MSPHLSLIAADVLVDALAATVEPLPAAETVDVRPYLRGAARDDDSEAFVLLEGLGFSAAIIAQSLPRARAAARAHAGA